MANSALLCLACLHSDVGTDVHRSQARGDHGVDRDQDPRRYDLTGMVGEALIRLYGLQCQAPDSHRHLDDGGALTGSSCEKPCIVPLL